MKPSTLDFTRRWLQRFEGFRPHPYKCEGGFRTIGYGHVMEASFPYTPPLSPEEAHQLLDHDIHRMHQALRRLTPVSLAWYQEVALLSLLFNIGPFAFMRSTLRRKVLRQDHTSVAGEFTKWVWAGGRKVPGLLRRRLEEARLYQGEWHD